MARLKTVAKHISTTTERSFPQLPSGATAVGKAVALMGNPVRENPFDIEHLALFLERMSSRQLPSCNNRDLNFLLHHVWYDPSHSRLGLDALDEARRRQRRSNFRSIIAGYLRYFPADHEVIKHLSSAAFESAQRVGEPWLGRGEKWKLWDSELGPSAVGRALIESEAVPVDILPEQIGLGSHIHSTRFGEQAFRHACQYTASIKGEDAIAAQIRLLDLVSRNERDITCDPVLVLALLAPWLHQTPNDSHRRTITDFLLQSVGDPRIASTRWTNVHNEIASIEGTTRASSIVSILRRWLTDAAMRVFFKAIASTTERKDQWREREQFWLGYLDAGDISDAWFALGPRAKADINKMIAASGERVDFANLNTGGGSDASHSSLLMRLGDLVIAEWSHNGACRFWRDTNTRAPRLFAKSYDTSRLKAMSDGDGFFHVSHMGNWQSRFAGEIYRETGIRHSVFGRGH